MCAEWEHLDTSKDHDERPTQWALIEYVIDDGESPPETHRWIVPRAVLLDEVLEWVDNTTTIERDSVRLYSVSVWE